MSASTRPRRISARCRPGRATRSPTCRASRSATARWTKARVQTGVTVIRPHAGDPFLDKRARRGRRCSTASARASGCVQVEELGVLETPIALTNTFARGAPSRRRRSAQAIAANPRDRARVADGQPAGVRVQRRLSERYPGAWPSARQHYLRGLRRGRRRTVAQGSVGAGRGMSCFELKGGIGSASRVVRASRAIPSARWCWRTSAACRR